MSAAQLDREWSLYSDWCASTDRSPMPTNAETIGLFLRELPAPLSTHARRIKAIRRAHSNAGVPLYLPRPDMPKVKRSGSEWATIPEALRGTPKLRFPVGLRGRRDAFLLVMIGILDMTRAEAQGIHQSEIQLFPDMSIMGRHVPSSPSASDCPRCAVSRWLRIVNLAAFGARNDMRVMLNPMNDLDQHDCLQGLNGEWRAAPVLLPAIDRYGWVDNSGPLSLRAISGIVARRQGEPVEGEQHWVMPENNGRFKDASSEELADAYDDVDEKLAELLLRTASILEESDELLGHIGDIS